jgi:hypothetical protein
MSYLFPAGARSTSPSRHTCAEQGHHRRAANAIAVNLRLAATAAAVVVAVPVTAVAASHTEPSAGGVVAAVGATTATLSNGVVARRWSVADGVVRTVSLTGAGGSWAAPGDDFAIDVDGVPTSSSAGWSLIGVSSARPPALPSRPASGTGAALLFRYSLASDAVAAVGVELDRLVVLHPGASVFETTTTLIDHGPAAVRIASYTLDQVTGRDASLPAEVQAYNGGSDWRDDYRHVRTEAGPFDDEGEVARFGTDAGYFLVSQRRGGSMSRVGRDASGRSFAGVDWARDAFDWGPLQTSPPTYNRQDNPVYPVPVRARLLRPLETLQLGTAYLGVYSGGAQEAAAAFTRDFVGADEPAFEHSVDLNTFHPWGHGDGMSDANLRTQVDAAKALGVDTFMLDDQWQGGPGGESGDWRFDPARFPDNDDNRVPDFVDYLHAQGLRLGLWMSPLEFNGASQTYAAHPDWACAPIGVMTAQVPDDAGLGVWDATNPAFQAYLVGVVDRLVRDYDVREFKFDFMAWVDCADHDYADYEDAFVAIVRRMQERHPDVTFELDETNDQRAWPFESAALGPSWFDNAHLHGTGPVPKLLHDAWSASPWVPTASMGAGVYDGTLSGAYAGATGVDFLFPLAMLTHATFWTDLTTLSPAEQAETAWWIAWYHAHRDGLGPAVYELTASDPLDGQSWAAWEPWTGVSGYVFAFRQSGGPNSEQLSLHGVDPRRVYSVTDVRSGKRLGAFRGADLATGLALALAPNTAAVLEIVPVSGT